MCQNIWFLGQPKGRSAFTYSHACIQYADFLINFKWKSAIIYGFPVQQGLWETFTPNILFLIIYSYLHLLVSPGQHCPIIPPHKPHSCNIWPGPAILSIMWRMGKDAITGWQGHKLKVEDEMVTLVLLILDKTFFKEAHTKRHQKINHVWTFFFSFV